MKCGEKHGPSTGKLLPCDEGCGRRMLITPNGAWLCPKCDIGWTILDTHQFLVA